MNQELMILLISVNEANWTTRQTLCRSKHIAKCKYVSCSNCSLQTILRGYTVDLTNTAIELIYEPRTISNT